MGINLAFKVLIVSRVPIDIILGHVSHKAAVGQIHLLVLLAFPCQYFSTIAPKSPTHVSPTLGAGVAQSM